MEETKHIIACVTEEIEGMFHSSQVIMEKKFRNATTKIRSCIAKRRQ